MNRPKHYAVGGAAASLSWISLPVDGARRPDASAQPRPSRSPSPQQRQDPDTGRPIMTPLQLWLNLNKPKTPSRIDRRVRAFKLELQMV